MILWTIQDEKAYQQLLKKGVLQCDKNHRILFPEFRKAYWWMASRMRKCIGDEPLGVAYPIWAWYQWEGKRKRPDMRSHRYYGRPGEKIVLLTIDVPDDKVLLSDYDWWHCVLNDCPIYFGDEDKEIISIEKEDSWDLIFDLQNPGLCEGLAHQSIQAAMWEIRLEWVKKAEIFWSKQIEE